MTADELIVIWSGQLERQGACQGLSGYSTKLADPAAALEDAEALGGVSAIVPAHIADQRTSVTRV
jgi:hypothetical protein